MLDHRMPDLRAELAKRIEGEDLDGAWALLERRADVRRDDREVARMWLELLRHSPSRASLIVEASEIVDAFPTDPTLVATACAALIGAAERRPMDEPPLTEDGPARRAAASALRCIESLSAPASHDPEVAGLLWIHRANALRYCGPSADEAAQEAFSRALALDDRGWWWFDLGVLHKWRGRFAQGFDCNLKAQARVGQERPVLWNLAICATATGDGDVAAGVWRQLGMPAEVSSAGMPFVDGLPPAQVRVLARGPGTGGSEALPDRAVGFELVWVAPLSPCHGVVQSPTFRDAPIDYGDVVLWDGAPVSVAPGPRGPVPRFPLLEILRRGDEHRLRFVAYQRDTAAAGIAGLGDALPDGCRLFVHEEQVEWPTEYRGDGTIATEKAPKSTESSPLAYGKILAPAAQDLPALKAAIEAGAKAAGLAIAVPALYEQLGDSKRAGQEHQAWLGIERRATRH